MEIFKNLVGDIGGIISNLSSTMSAIWVFPAAAWAKHL